MSQPLSAHQGETIYLDTMIPYALVRGIEPTAPMLFERIEQGSLRAFTSVLTFDELSYRLLLALIRDALGGSPLDQLRQNEATLIQRFYPSVSTQLAKLRAFPNLTLVDVTARDLDRMDEAIRQYQLRPRDALHLAAMQKVGCMELLSNDADWARVPLVTRYTLP